MQTQFSFAGNDFGRFNISVWCVRESFGFALARAKIDNKSNELRYTSVYIYIPESFTSLCVFRIRDSVVPMKIKLRTHEKWRQLCLTSPFCLICFVAETPEHLMSFTVSRGT